MAITVDRIPAGRGAAGLAQLSRHAWALTGALCALVVILDIRGGDLAAQTFRVWLFRTNGFVVWDSRWYAGHTDIGYGPLFPALAAHLGMIPVAVAACVASTVLFCRLVGPAGAMPGGAATAVARVWFAVAVVIDLAVGRLPFACGLACGLAALLAMRSRQPWLALAAAVACSLFSPLAGLCLLLATLAWLPDLGWRKAAPALGAGAGIALAAAGGDGGVFPFPWWGLVTQLAFVACALALTTKDQALLRRGLAIYGLACIAMFALPNPVGSNIVRIASIVAGSLAAYILLKVERPLLLAFAAVPIIVWQATPLVGVADATVHDPSAQASYYAGVVDYLVHHTPIGSRVEIPPTAQHWESTYVAERIPLTRGWDRQVDLRHNAALYSPLTAATYRAWLLDQAVTTVALPLDTPMDPGGVAERALLQHPPVWLAPAYRDAHWQVWRVLGATPLVSSPARLAAQTPGGFSVVFDAPGTSVVRLRWSSYWRLDVGKGQACLAPTATGWTQITATRSGPVAVSAAFPGGGDNRCPGSG